MNHMCGVLLSLKTLKNRMGGQIMNSQTRTKQTKVWPNKKTGKAKNGNRSKFSNLSNWKREA